jgi:hypothetical protein
MTGSICGERVQKNFPTELMARTFMNGFIAAANQGESSRPRFIACCDLCSGRHGADSATRIAALFFALRLVALEKDVVDHPSPPAGSCGAVFVSVPA